MKDCIALTSSWQRTICSNMPPLNGLLQSSKMPHKPTCEGIYIVWKQRTSGTTGLKADQLRCPAFDRIGNHPFHCYPVKVLADETPRLFLEVERIQPDLISRHCDVDSLQLTETMRAEDALTVASYQSSAFFHSSGIKRGIPTTAQSAPSVTCKGNSFQHPCAVSRNG